MANSPGTLPDLRLPAQGNPWRSTCRYGSRTLSPCRIAPIDSQPMSGPASRRFRSRALRSLDLPRTLRLPRYTSLLRRRRRRFQRTCRYRELLNPSRMRDLTLDLRCRWCLPSRRPLVGRRNPLRLTFPRLQPLLQSCMILCRLLGRRPRVRQSMRTILWEGVPASSSRRPSTTPTARRNHPSTTPPACLKRIRPPRSCLLPRPSLLHGQTLGRLQLRPSTLLSSRPR